MGSRRPLLFRRFPGLIGKVPWMPLGVFPTPVEPMKNLGRHLGADRLFVKRDDLSGEVYGGNKVRKLEFLLGDVLERGRGPVITVGAVGSNHLLATAVYGRRAGVPVIGVLVPQPVQENLRANLLCDYAQGCRLEYVPSEGAAAKKIAGLYLSEWIQNRRRPYLVWAGGSNRPGVLGYVEAGLEIAEQVRAGLLPEPAFIFVPVGSGGTLAGLLLGVMFAGLRSRPVGVRVFNRAAANEKTVAFLANRTLRWLHKKCSRLPAVPVSPREVFMLHDYFGPGYAHYTRKGVAAMKLVQELEGMALEGTYSGKNMAAFLDFVQRPENQGRPALFINTYNSRPLSPLQEGSPDYKALPPALHEYFEKPPAGVEDETGGG